MPFSSRNSSPSLSGANKLSSQTDGPACLPFSESADNLSSIFMLSANALIAFINLRSVEKCMKCQLKKINYMTGYLVKLSSILVKHAVYTKYEITSGTKSKQV